MATFTKTAQNVMGAVNIGASVAGALGLGSTLRTPTSTQGEFNGIRELVHGDLRKYGIQKTNLAYVSFSLPNVLRIPGLNQEAVLLATHRAGAFPAPGVSLATSELRRYGVGPVEKKPYLPTFADIPVEFIGDSNGNIHKFFYLWMNGIVNFLDLPRENANSDKFGTSSKKPFALEYKDNYKTTLRIRTFNDNQESLADIILENAFPVSMSEIQYNWNDESQLVRFTVNFTYTHWKYDVESSKFNFAPPGKEREKSGFDLIYNFLTKIYPAAQAIELATRKPRQIQDISKIVNAGKTGLSPITKYY